LIFVLNLSNRKDIYGEIKYLERSCYPFDIGAFEPTSSDVRTLKRPCWTPRYTLDTSFTFNPFSAIEFTRKRQITREHTGTRVAGRR